MQVEKNILKSSITSDDEKNSRYLLRLEWEKTKKSLCIVMLSAGVTNGICFDRTTNYVLENASSLDYGAVDIVNLFSSVDTDFDEDCDQDNIKAIDTSAKNADIVIFAVGTGHKSNKKVQKRQKEVLAILKKYDKKLYCIADEKGNKFYHPLCPKVRKWNLQKFDIAELSRKGYEYD